ncbi:hypothetical protein SBA1_1100007 [Candidatus Sulfotelmatobacter kueseliae]|uniref:Uncharacterized protein n=1 Tax=Candidatus Sulfotelmatobacter kueseliae TaxID=2042962 RepID=A0A2U3JZS5_9BACT|nr:hypothetical protein SBA1_1100007 [Candidatus Sulfotelmatobacter kueseliae]
MAPELRYCHPYRKGAPAMAVFNWRQNVIIFLRFSVFSSEHDIVSCRRRACRGVAQPGRAPGSGHYGTQGSQI